MKDAKSYEKKIKKLLTGMKKAKAPAAQADPVETLIRATLEENASEAHATRAMEIFAKEFINFNELRVALPGEIVDLLDKSYPNPQATAAELTAGLNKVFYDANGLTMDHLAELAKRELRQKLVALGLSPFVAGSLVLFAFQGHAIPVDADLVETLAMDGDIAADSKIEDVQGFLERIVAQKDAMSAHALFRSHVAKRGDALAKVRKVAQREREAAEQAAAEAAEAEAKAKAEKKAAAEAKAVAKAAAADAKAAAEAEAEKAAAKAAKKATKKAAKKAAKKPVAKKAAKKTTKKAAKAPEAKKAVKKKVAVGNTAAKKAVKKVAKKKAKK